MFYTGIPTFLPPSPIFKRRQLKAILQTILPSFFLFLFRTMVIFQLRGWSTTSLMKVPLPEKGFDSRGRKSKTTGILQRLPHYRQKRLSSPLLFTFKACKAQYISFPRTLSCLLHCKQGNVMRTAARHVLTHQFWKPEQGCGEQHTKRDMVLFPVEAPHAPLPPPRLEEAAGKRGA